MWVGLCKSVEWRWNDSVGLVRLGLVMWFGERGWGGGDPIGLWSGSEGGSSLEWGWWVTKELEFGRDPTGETVNWKVMPI